MKDQDQDDKSSSIIPINIIIFFWREFTNIDFSMSKTVITCQEKGSFILSCWKMYKLATKYIEETKQEWTERVERCWIEEINLSVLKRFEQNSKQNNNLCQQIRLTEKKGLIWDWEGSNTKCVWLEYKPLEIGWKTKRQKEKESKWKSILSKIKKVL